VRFGSVAHLACYQTLGPRKPFNSPLRYVADRAANRPQCGPARLNRESIFRRDPLSCVSIRSLRHVVARSIDAPASVPQRRVRMDAAFYADRVRRIAVLILTSGHGFSLLCLRACFAWPACRRSTVGRNARPLTRIGGLPGMRPGRRLLVKTDPLLLDSTLFSNQSGWNARRRPSAHVSRSRQVGS